MYGSELIRLSPFRVCRIVRTKLHPSSSSFSFSSSASFSSSSSTTTSSSNSASTADTYRCSWLSSPSYSHPLHSHSFYRSFSTSNSSPPDGSDDSPSSSSPSSSFFSSTSSIRSLQLQSLPDLIPEKELPTHRGKSLHLILSYIVRSSSFRPFVSDLDPSISSAYYRSFLVPFLTHYRSKSLLNEIRPLLQSIHDSTTAANGKSDPTKTKVFRKASRKLAAIFLNYVYDKESTNGTLTSAPPITSSPSTAPTTSTVPEFVKDGVVKYSVEKETNKKQYKSKQRMEDEDENEDEDDDEDDDEFTLTRPSSSTLLSRTRNGKLRFDPSLEFVANLTEPHEWYPTARSLGRSIIVHCGPTNSGKTYSALKALKEAKSGVYCGPLRLLAWEIYEQITAAGKSCNLRTGQEKVELSDAAHTSCTVEMASTSTIVDVGVIDEMQMVGSSDRGHAWTRALLGLPAKELHICGDPTMISIVEQICAITGESFTVKTYERLTPLQISAPLVQGYKGIRKGDCVIAFGRKALYNTKREIETNTGLKCCIIYGSLPPETRKSQAELFNMKDSGFDVLVASDAIGMGLNLNIRRVIFFQMNKYDGMETRLLLPTEVKQIGGRAGRFSSNFPAGFVTTFEPDSFEDLERQMNQPLPPLMQAGLLPTYEQIAQMALEKANENLSSLFQYYKNFARVDQTYFMCDMANMMDIADAIQHIPLALKDRFTFTQAPADMKREHLKYVLVEFATQLSKPPSTHDRDDGFLSSSSSSSSSSLSEYGHVTLDCVQKSLYVLRRPASSELDISDLESLYSMLDVYNWLAGRFGSHVFVDVEKAKLLSQETGERIAKSLVDLSSAWGERRAKLLAKFKANKHRRTLQDTQIPNATLAKLVKQHMEL